MIRSALAAAAVFGGLAGPASQAAELVLLPPHLAETPLAEALASYRALGARLPYFAFAL